MRILLQRVLQASVSIDHQQIASIGEGALALIGFGIADTPQAVTAMFDRLCRYRAFADENRKTNKSVLDVKGSLLLVPQFTLYADTTGGLRPRYAKAAPPAQAQALFEHLQYHAQFCGVVCRFGCFGAYMHVQLTNDGPMTLLLSDDE